jgi:hypothetical protein
MVARGMLAALMLAVPVAVAAAIGFEGSLTGLGGGLDSLASGPDAQPATTVASEELDDAITTIGGGPGAPGGDGGGDGPQAEPPNEPGGGPGGGGGGSGSGTGTAQGGGGGPVPGGADLGVPNDDGGGAGGVVDGVSDTVNGLLGQ